MSLGDLLNQGPVEQPRRIRAPHPKGWEPGVKFITEQARYITTEVLPTLEGEPDWRSAIDQMGITIPEGYRVRIAEMKFDPAAWTRDSEDQKLAVTKPVWRYRFIVEPDVSDPSSEDGIDILNRLIRTPKEPECKMTGVGAFIVNLNDTQIGKDAGGGTPVTLERVERYITLAVARAIFLSAYVDECVILLGGDLIEGCSIYPNQESQIDLDMRGQIRTMTAIVLSLLDRIAPLFTRVRVLAVPGNHGENRKNGKRVNRHDNFDQLVAEAAAMAAERDEALKHVSFIIAYEEAALAIEVQGHILGLTHGSIYGKGTGGSPALKAYNWYKNMAAGRYPVGDADILVGNHFHHEIITNFGTLLFVQNPAMDGGSPEFGDSSGTDCAPGMATWVMTPESKFTMYEVLR